VSLRVDGELSELESRLLDRHLDACAACAGWQRSLLATAELIRSAPVERLSVPVSLPAPGRHGMPVRRVLVVAAVVAAAARGTVVGASLDRGSSRAPAPPAPQLSLLERRDVQSQRPRPAQQVTPPPTIRRLHIPPEDAV
jgi:anti-sigma factor RsiW